MLFLCSLQFFALFTFRGWPRTIQAPQHLLLVRRMGYLLSVAIEPAQNVLQQDQPMFRSGNLLQYVPGYAVREFVESHSFNPHIIASSSEAFLSLARKSSTASAGESCTPVR